MIAKVVQSHCSGTVHALPAVSRMSIGLLSKVGTVNSGYMTVNLRVG